MKQTGARLSSAGHSYVRGKATLSRSRLSLLWVLMHQEVSRVPSIFLIERMIVGDYLAIPRFGQKLLYFGIRDGFPFPLRVTHLFLYRVDLVGVPCHV